MREAIKVRIRFHSADKEKNEAMEKVLNWWLSTEDGQRSLRMGENIMVRRFQEYLASGNDVFLKVPHA